MIAQTSPRQDVYYRVRWFPDRNSAPSRRGILLQGLLVFKDYSVSVGAPQPVYRCLEPALPACLVLTQNDYTALINIILIVVKNPPLEPKVSTVANANFTGSAKYQSAWYIR